MFLPYKITTEQIEQLLQDGTSYEGYSALYASLEKKVKQQMPVEKIKQSYINGSRLQEDWFPVENNRFHVFISHSHRDVGLVKKFAFWLKQNLGIDCFIDSVYWKYSDTLLKEIDKEWCRYYSKSAKQFLYYYENRNFSTSNIHCMLTMALMKMMDRCECVIFVDSDKSIQYKKGNTVRTTQSPWIYEEIELVNHLRWIVPDRLVKNKILDENRQVNCFSSCGEMPTFYYDANMCDFINLDAKVLRDVKRYMTLNELDKNGELALDKLYEISGSKKQMFKRFIINK